MTNGNYEKILKKISKSANLEEEEVKRRVEAKRAKLSGLISEEGAAQVVAAELGINFENEQLKIDELLPGMRKVNTVGKIINLYPVRKFTNKKGEEGKVANMFIADENSNVKVVLWDTNHIEPIEKGEVVEGSVIEINNATMRGNELHLGSFSEFKKSDKEIKEVNKERIVKEKPISDFALSDDVQTRAVIVQSFPARFFNVCPECKKKVFPDDSGEGYKCNQHGKVTPEKRALLNIILDDGTETIRSVVFSDNFDKLGIDDFKDQEKLGLQRENLLGKELFFSGKVRNNKYFNSPELIIDEVEEINLDNLISELEGKSK
ncbi:MAG TPA: DUF2240 family protein [Candidatus Nanoarchaeia archaeon]|nr:DUF2240 family protein [Candidatus Nanoarchaeia archaeon]